MKRPNRPHSLVLVLCCVGLPSQAAQRSGASFLSIPQGARAVALSNAFTAGSDATSLFHNVAGIVGPGRAASYSHQRLFADIRTDSLSYLQPFPGMAVGLGLIRLSQGAIEARDSQGREHGAFESSDLAASVGLAAKVSGLIVGANVKYIEQKIESERAAGFALDLGLQKRVSSRLSLGAAVQNLGPQMRFVSEPFRLPLSLNLGAGLGVLSGLRVYGDLKHRPYDKRTEASMGAEYSLLPALSLRSGYLAMLRQEASPSAPSPLSGIGAGFGLALKALTLDYAFTPMGELGQAQRITLAMRWGTK